MITIAIELNHVIRNINKQLLKYYQRDYNEELDIEDIDEKSENVLSKYIKFDSKKELNEFIYIDYPYEIFGCANTMEKKLAVKITNWLTDISNIEDEEIRIVFYSLNEGELTIQSTYFFLSKIVN
jgi:16S rRNA G966 N2-methylase RsmD